VDLSGPPEPLGPEEEPWEVLVVGGPAKPSTPLETLARSAMASGQMASAEASEATAVATEIAAQRAAEAAEDAATGAEDANIDASRASKLLGEARLQEKSSLANALGEEQSTSAALGKSRMYVANLDTVAYSALAKSGLEDELLPIYKGLQEWKMNMLHPPVIEGRKASVQAARPFEEQLEKIETEVGAYQQQAVMLSGQARTMRTEAVDLANFAVKQQAEGQLLGARDDMMRAHQMMTHAQMIESQAHDIQKAAQELNLKVPLYVVAAQNAAQEAMHRYNPDRFAPPPLGRGPFLRPPPVGAAAR